MNLYDGYQIGTETESYAWINLDAVKLLEMDEDSQIHLEKEDRHLKIQLDHGDLFFCVTEKLEKDESLEFTFQIRQTCLWLSEERQASLSVVPKTLHPLF